MTVDPAIVLAVIGFLGTALGAAGRLIYKDMRRDIEAWKLLAQESERDIARLTARIESDLAIRVPPVVDRPPGPGTTPP